MSKRFSELPAADVPLVGNEKFAVTQGGASKKTTREHILAPAVQTNAQSQIDRVVRIPITTITSGTTLSLDFAVTNNFEITLSHNATLAAPSNAGVGQCGRILVRQDATGSRTLAYNTIWKFVDGEAPVLTTNGNALDLLVYEVLSETEILLQLLSDIK